MGRGETLRVTPVSDHENQYILTKAKMLVRCGGAFDVTGRGAVDYPKLLQNELVAPGEFPVCFAFSIHKAGSSLMNQMISEACSIAGIPAANIPSALFKAGIPDKVWNADSDLPRLVVPGRIYYGFRYLPDMLLDPTLRLREKRSVLLVRDPRDALVSQFFSFDRRHGSHRPPDNNQETFRHAVKNDDIGIDEYVVRFAANHLDKLNVYLEQLDFGMVLLRRYEEVYFDKLKFLTDIFSHFEIEVPGSVIGHVAATNDIRPAREDPRRHVRKGEPGDHRLKLRPETIIKLNKLFGATCVHYGYDLAL